MSWARMPRIPAPANPENQLRGAVSRAQGGYFEDLLDAACKWYEMQDTALIEKTPEPMRPIKRLGDGKYIDQHPDDRAYIESLYPGYRLAECVPTAQSGVVIGTFLTLYLYRADTVLFGVPKPARRE